MRVKSFCILLVVCVLVFSFAVCSFAQEKRNLSRQQLTEQLNRARKDFIAQRDQLHDQTRVLRAAWHDERDVLYAQVKKNPKDKNIHEALNAGAKKFHSDRKEVYKKLVELRKNWLTERKELGRKIKQAK